ncbi:MAG: beta galactosidase jelly roll domain-containing protein [Gemmatimonadetes bacterium]|nr:beta galactosidase jelly roll domain-containing protein [Gemmatimonadota bacterium]
MGRIIAIFLSCVLLSASSLLASNVEDTYQAALTQEKGEGNLEEAIRLYKQVIEAHEKGEGDEGLAARAQLRIGVCQEKLGLAQARQTYEAVREKYSDQPQVEVEAEQRLESAHQREEMIEEPSHRPTSESYIHRQLQQIMERAKRQTELTERQMKAIHRKLTKWRLERAKRDTGADSAFSDERMRRQLEAAQRQMEQQMKQTERQMEALQRQLERQQEQMERQMKHAERQMKRGIDAHAMFLGDRMHGIQDYVESIKSSLGVGVDSVFIDEQVRRQLKALQQQMEQAKRQMKQTNQQIEWQSQSSHDLPFHDNILLSWKFLGTERKTDIKKFLRRATDIDPVAKVPTKWEFHLDADRKPMERPSRFHEYAPANFDDAEWANIEIGRPWSEQGYTDYEGGAWYRTKLTIAADRVRPVQMYIEGKYQSIEVYVNGRTTAFVGSDNIMERPLILDIGPIAVRDGENTVALYVYGGTNRAGIDRINVYQPIFDWASPSLKKGADQQYSSYANSPVVIPYSHKKVAKVPTQWKFRLDERLDERRLNPLLDREYAAPGFDDSEWADISIGQAWEAQGYAGYNGGAWYRTPIKVDAKEGQPVHLAFGGVDQHATVYVNGHWVGEHNKWSRPFILDISDQVIRDGNNTVALYVFDGEGMGGIYGTLQVIQPTKEENLDRYLANRSSTTW